MPIQPLNNEKALLTQIVQGNETAFRIVFDHYRDALYSFALKVVQHEVIAEEIVQDVFVKIWMNRQGLSAIRNFADFLFIITRNHTLNSLRRLAKEKKLTIAATGQLPMEAISAEATILQRDYDRVLQQAIDRLPPQQKLVFTLSRLQGLSREEVAAQLNISAGTVKTHMKQAIRSIRSYFKDHNNAILCLMIAILIQP